MDWTKVYILNYQNGDEVITHVHWTRENAVIELYNIWINSKRNLMGEMAREAWNSLVNDGLIPEVGSIEEADMPSVFNIIDYNKETEDV